MEVVDLRFPEYRGRADRILRWCLGDPAKLLGRWPDAALLSAKHARQTCPGAGSGDWPGVEALYLYLLEHETEIEAPLGGGEYGAEGECVSAVDDGSACVQMCAEFVAESAFAQEAAEAEHEFGEFMEAYARGTARLVCPQTSLMGWRRDLHKRRLCRTSHVLPRRYPDRSGAALAGRTALAGRRTLAGQSKAALPQHRTEIDKPLRMGTSAPSALREMSSADVVSLVALDLRKIALAGGADSVAHGRAASPMHLQILKTGLGRRDERVKLWKALHPGPAPATLTVASTPTKTSDDDAIDHTAIDYSEWAASGFCKRGSPLEPEPQAPISPPVSPPPAVDLPYDAMQPASSKAAGVKACSSVDKVALVTPAVWRLSDMLGTTLRRTPSPPPRLATVVHCVCGV